MMIFKFETIICCLYFIEHKIDPLRDAVGMHHLK